MACSGEGATACRSRCRREYPSGFDDALAAALACQATSCSFECDFGCGGYIAAYDACSSCVTDYDNCCKPSTECMSSTACVSLVHCLHGCGSDLVCQDDCRLAHPEGEKLAADLGQCAEDHCAALCGAWSCLGHLTSAEPLPGVLDLFVLTLYDQKNVPLSGLQVRACNRSDYFCAQPVIDDRPPSNADGTVTFLHLLPSGFDGYFEVTGPSIEPTLLFLPTPVMGIKTGFLAQLFAPSDLTPWAGVLGPAAIDRGTVVFSIRDCTGGPAVGASISVDTTDTMVKPFYFKAGSPALFTSVSDASGEAGLWNVPAATELPVRASVAANDALIASHTVFVRAGAVTEAEILPEPR
jgi:hypothetical protein